MSRWAKSFELGRPARPQTVSVKLQGDASALVAAVAALAAMAPAPRSGPALVHQILTRRRWACEVAGQHTLGHCPACGVNQ